MDWVFHTGWVGPLVVATGWVLVFRHRVRQLRAEIFAQLERGEAYDLQLATNIEQVMGRRPTERLLIPTLWAMEREGLIVSQRRQDAPGGRIRAYYRLVE